MARQTQRSQQGPNAWDATSPWITPARELQEDRLVFVFEEFREVGERIITVLGTVGLIGGGTVRRWI
jgi:hypothetical protein